MPQRKKKHSSFIKELRAYELLSQNGPLASSREARSTKLRFLTFEFQTGINVFV